MKTSFEFIVVIDKMHGFGKSDMRIEIPFFQCSAIGRKIENKTIRYNLGVRCIKNPFCTHIFLLFFFFYIFFIYKNFIQSCPNLEDPSPKVQ